MSSSPNTEERPNERSHFDDGGLYNSAGGEQVTALPAQIENEFEGESRKSLELLQRSANSIFDYVRRNPMRVAIGVAGVAALLAAWSRRSRD